MPISIREKRKRQLFSELEILDIANSVINMINNSQQYSGIDPDTVMLGPDNEVSMAPRSGQTDEAFTAPEVSGIVSEAVDLNKADASAAAAYFSLGMLIYYMAKGCDWYQANNESLLGIPEYKEKRDSLISDSNVFGGVLCELTSWDPEARISVGLVNLSRMIANAPASVMMHYIYNGSEIKSEEIHLRGTGIKGFGEGIEIYDDRGSMYKSRGTSEIPFRPGVHDMHFEVVKASDGASNTSTGSMGTTDKAFPAVRKKLIVKTEGIEAGYNEYDTGYLFEGRLEADPSVVVKGTVRYRFYVVDTDDSGNRLDEKLIDIYTVTSGRALRDCRLFVIVDNSGNGKAVIYNDSKGQPLTDTFKFKVQR